MPILTGSAAYAVAQAFGWRYGLDRKFGRCRDLYGVIAASTSSPVPTVEALGRQAVS